MDWKKLGKSAWMSLNIFVVIVIVANVIELISASPHAYKIAFSVMVFAVFCLFTHFVYTEMEDEDD